MRPALNPESIRTILLDIEGTTTPVDFVYKVLFPFAHARMQDFLTKHFSEPDVQEAIIQLYQEYLQDEKNRLNPPPQSENAQPEHISSLVAYIHWLMDADRKSTPLKMLQGKIWEVGYHSGELCGEVFADVPSAFARWQKQGKAICIYSSGSVLAQQLIFAHTNYGDLTPYIQDYFDTNMGAKKSPESYTRIAEHINCSPSNLLFISDSISELDAARAANLQTICSVRPGNQPLSDEITHLRVSDFDEVLR